MMKHEKMHDEIYEFYNDGAEKMCIRDRFCNYCSTVSEGKQQSKSAGCPLRDTFEKVYGKSIRKKMSRKNVQEKTQ